MLGMSETPVSRRGYGPPDGQASPRFSGVRTFMRVPHVSTTDGVDVAIVGIPFDTGTSFRPGARFGPMAIRNVSSLLRPFHPHHRVDVFEHLSVVDFGDAGVIPGNIERTYSSVADTFGQLADASVTCIGLGGDHSVTLAELRVLAERVGPLALLQFDAHADTWDEYFGERYSHGTTFRRATEEGLLRTTSSIQVGMRGSLYQANDLRAGEELGFEVITCDELRSLGPQAFAQAVNDRVGECPTFVSFDVDFVDPAFAPGTGTPEVGGVTSGEAMTFLRALSGVNIVGSDCVEVAAAYDSPGEPTALLAANVVWEMLALIAVHRRAPNTSTVAT